MKNFFYNLEFQQICLTDISKLYSYIKIFDNQQISREILVLILGKNENFHNKNNIDFEKNHEKFYDINYILCNINYWNFQNSWLKLKIILDELLEENNENNQISIILQQFIYIILFHFFYHPEISSLYYKIISSLYETIFKQFLEEIQKILENENYLTGIETIDTIIFKL